MHMFYNKTTLKDTLVIKLNDKIATSRKTIKDGVLFYNGDELTGMNLFNVSKQLEIPSGLLYPSKNIIAYIEGCTKLKIPAIDNGKHFVVGTVKSCEVIPNTHLHLCEVDIKNKVLQIVCGAKNVRNNINVVVAPVGAMMPNGMLIKPGKLMNQKSFGMLCSAKELMIKSDNNTVGILELDKKNLVGELYQPPYVNLNSSKN